MEFVGLDFRFSQRFLNGYERVDILPGIRGFYIGTHWISLRV
jgi:hypothetical protein